MNDRSIIDYLVVGHVTRDITPNGWVAGGTATYSSLVAQALGCRTAVVTSAAQDIDLFESRVEFTRRKAPTHLRALYLSDSCLGHLILSDWNQVSRVYADLLQDGLSDPP